MDKDPLLFKIAHISDLHFSKISFGLSQFFSKRCIGNLNLILNRCRTYKNDRPFSLVHTFKKHQISHVLITGDVSTTSSKEEFLIAQKLVEEFQKEHMQVFVIPGNHDAYTKSAYKKQLFYQYFEDQHTPSLGFTLKENKVSGYALGEGWWLVKLDTTYPAPFYHSTGSYTQKQDQDLRTLLDRIPKEDSIILINHFPLFYYEHPKRIMLGAELLRATLSLYPHVKLYLHGHTHRHTIADLRGNHLPIVLDSGSAAHAKRGSWNLLEIYRSGCSIEMHIPDDNLLWNSQKTCCYEWS